MKTGATSYVDSIGYKEVPEFLQPENPLKAAEQTTEQNYNMIDGQINNTPTAAELEAKAKAGEQISLFDYAKALKEESRQEKAAKPEKKPSIRAQLRADIYHEGSKAQLMENMTAALPYMDADMRELAERTISKVNALTDEEYAELALYAADEA